MNNGKESEYIDYNLYSRQIGTFGISTMKKLIKLKVLILGLKGLGVEVAKNIILSGPKEVCIFDPKIVSINDLGSNFYLKEEYIGKKRRDESCLDDLKKLNPYTKVSILNLDDNEYKNLFNYFNLFNIIVITEFKLKEELIKINNFCRKNKIGFIYGVNLGLSGFLFNDFSDEHYIIDLNGIENKKYFCKEISNEKTAKVFLDEDSKNIFLKINTFVKFTGVEGMIELNNSKPIKILNKEDNILTLDINTISFGKYLNRGFISQAKIPLKKSYKSLEDRFEIPYEDKFNEQDYQKEGRNELLFICLKGLNEFCLDNDGNLPEINNYDHAKKFIEITKKIYEEAKNKSLFWTDEIQLWDEKVVEKYSLWSRCEIPPLTSFLGGLISQEIIKYTGKYIPIDQWLFFDFFEAVEQLENEYLKEKIIDDRKILENSRYNDLISIFGNEVFKKLTEKNIFMIGAGAVGCEFLKNLSLIGFSTNKLEENNQNGIITVTDNDNIAVSNLNRQFLFHKENINQSKSKCASDSAKAINRNINIKSYSELVCYENEYLFNDEFWINQDFVICAVDTIDGRKYIDQMCTKYDKILTDSGTNGVEGRFQLIIPYLTSCINDREFKVHYEPSCTIKSYPTKYEHCVEWSRSFFNEEFNLKINELIIFLNNYQNFIQNIDELNFSNIEEKEKINKIFNYIILIDGFLKYKNINIFKEYSLFQFNILFKEQINSLFQVNPKIINNETNPFWNNKKMPHIIDFDNKDSINNLFIESYCKILCRLFGVNNVAPNDIIIKENIKFYSDKELDEINLDFFLNKIKNSNILDYDKQQIKSEMFDKDDLNNSHLDFIYSSSVLRARNHNIPEEDKNKTHLIAGNIIPSIPSINPILAGMLSLQLIILSYTKNLKYIRKGVFDLGNNIFTLIPPSPPKTMEDKTENNYSIINIPKGFTRWTKILVKGSKTCKEFIDWIKEIYNVNVNAIFADRIHIYQKFNTNNKKKIIEMNDNLKNTIELIYFQKLKKQNLIKNNKLKIIFLKINGKIDNNYINMPLFQYEY